VTLAFGRVWCGWACPQTVLGDLTARLDAWRRRGGARGAAAFALYALASALVAANLLWYFVPPGEFASRLVEGRLGPVLAGSWAVLGAVLFLDLALLRWRFCATACPYAKLQGALFDRHTLAIAYDARRAADCIDCGACVRVCPTGIDIRDGLQAACIACGECVDACAPILARLRRPPKLVGFFFGEPGARRRLLRPAVLALAGATGAALVLTAAVAAERAPLDLLVSPASQYEPRLAADGRAVNAYAVALENRGRAPVTLRLALAAGAARTSVRPEAVTLGPGEHRRLTVVASALGLGGSARSVSATLSAETAGGEVRAARRVPFVVPEAR
jgi:cytochrome c oxidase accessory protein FixG